MIGKLLADDQPPNTNKSESDNSILELPEEAKNEDVLELPIENSGEVKPLKKEESVGALRAQIENPFPANSASEPIKEGGAVKSFPAAPAELENLPPIGWRTPEIIDGNDKIQPEAVESAIEESAAPPMSAAAEIESGLDNAAPVEDLPQTSFEFSAFSTAPQKEAVDYAAEFDSGETARRSGLAWSAGIAFFGSVIFMLVIGWFADLLFGSKPWGIVGGIILGSIIGFIQFFRISAQIFKKPDSGKLDL